MIPHSSPRPTAGRFQLATRMQRLVPSAVREILKVAERPDIISFAGGLPAPELFPVAEVARAFEDVLAREGAAALQYSTTEGFLPLREWIAERLRRSGTKTSPEQLLLTSGSQQGIDLVAKVLLDPGDRVVVENPTYLAAVQAFQGYQAELVPLPSDDDGADIGALEEIIRHSRPRLIYLVTDFHNPKGTSLSLPRRKLLVELAGRYGIPVLEDDPYGELRFSGTPLPALSALDTERVVIRLGTFSKTLAPGLRIGWIHGPTDLVRKFTIAKQASDLHSATINQRAAARLLETFDYDGNLAKLRTTYGARRTAMMRALESAMPGGSSWTRPDGGLFLWVRLPDGLTEMQLFEAGMARGVAVVPGSGFCVGAAEQRFVRLNYSNQTVEKIELGIARLGEAAHEALASSAKRAAVE